MFWFFLIFDEEPTLKTKNASMKVRKETMCFWIPLVKAIVLCLFNKS